MTQHLDFRPSANEGDIIKVKGHQYWWLADSYDLEIGHF